jgi:hypothetical protein
MFMASELMAAKVETRAAALGAPTLAFVLVLGGLSACGGDEPDSEVPYKLGQALVIGDIKGGELEEVDESCDTAECEAVVARCGPRSFADVVLDEGSEVLDVLCYKPNVTVVEIGVDAVDTASAGNNTVLVLDAVDDGADVTGDVVLEGNNTIVYGEGAALSIIGGNLAIDKNNAIVRGVRINGDVTITKNNAKLAFCQIDGDLTVIGNNTTLAECVVHGEIQIEGNNTVLVQNQLADDSPVLGKTQRCNGNVTFDDDDEDLIVDEGELGAEVICDDEVEGAPPPAP